MKDEIVFYLPWVISLITIVKMKLLGNRNILGWVLGLGNQCLWLVWIVLSASWGLLPLNIALWYIYADNYRKWRKT